MIELKLTNWQSVTPCGKCGSRNFDEQHEEFEDKLFKFTHVREDMQRLADEMKVENTYTSHTSSSGTVFSGGGAETTTHEALTVVFSGLGMLLAYLKVLKPIVLQWFKNRAHSIKIKSKDISIEIKGPESYYQAVELIKKLEEKKEEERVDGEPC